MREWLSGGAPPCQGGGRGFDPRLALEKKRYQIGIVLFFEPCQGSKVRCLRSAPVRAVRGPPDLVRRLALFLFVAEALILQGFRFFMWLQTCTHLHPVDLLHRL